MTEAHHPTLALRLIAFCAITLLYPLADALAANPPIPTSELETVKHRMEAAARQKEQLEQQVKSTDASLTSIQGDLVAIARESQRQEARMDETRQRLASLKAQISKKQAALEAQKADIQRTQEAIIQLSGTPPAATLAMPGQTAEYVQNSIILDEMARYTQKKAALLQSELRELAELRNEADTARSVLDDRRRALDKSRQQLESKIAQRQSLQNNLNKDIASTADTIAKLSAKSTSLQELINQLEKQRAIQPKRKPKFAPKTLSSETIREAKGKLRMPIQGKIIRRFGEKDPDTLEKIKGIEIEAPSRSPIVAPLDGEVVYTGKFLSYGNMIILRHSGEYHTLIAGLNAINASPGQFVLEGEPVGSTGNVSQKDAILYMELRHNNKPIDPYPWLQAKR